MRINAGIIKNYKNMSKEFKASAAYTVCSILQKGLSFITLPLFVRLLTKEEYGQYTVYSSWAPILTIFITMNLAYGSFQTAMVKYKDRRAEYTSSISLLFALLGAAFLVIYLPFKDLWNKLFDLPTYLIVFMIVEIVALGVTDCWLAKNRFEYKYKSVIALTLSKSVLAPLLAFILVMSFEQKGYARIVGYALIDILFGLVVYVMVAAKGKTFYNKEFWTYALTFNVPLIPYYIAQMIFNVSDRLMISHFHGKDVAAVYGVAYSLAIMLNFLISAIESSYSPWFLTELGEGRGEKNRKVSLNLAMIVALGLWLIITMAPEIIGIMAGKDYAIGMWAVPPVAISTLLLFYCSLFDRVLFLYERRGLLLLGATIPCIINFVLNYIFIPKYGFIAAAYTTLISYIVFAILCYFNSKKALRDKNIYTSLYDVRGLIILFTAMCFLSGTVMALYRFLFIRVGIVLAVMVFLFIKRKAIIKIIKLDFD